MRHIVYMKLFMCVIKRLVVLKLFLFSLVEIIEAFSSVITYQQNLQCLQQLEITESTFGLSTVTSNSLHSLHLTILVRFDFFSQIPTFI